MIDEHTRESLLHVVERSIIAERFVTELKQVFAERLLRLQDPECIAKGALAACGQGQEVFS
jgi:putative transposase